MLCGFTSLVVCVCTSLTLRDCTSLVLFNYTSLMRSVYTSSMFGCASVYTSSMFVPSNALIFIENQYKSISYRRLRLACRMADLRKGRPGTQIRAAKCRGRLATAARGSLRKDGFWRQLFPGIIDESACEASSCRCALRYTVPTSGERRNQAQA
jgi:hypothetical protein